MKIGFIDYYLDEYHANHYPAWLRESSGENIEILAWAETGSPFPGGLTTGEWCEKYGARQLESIREVCEAADSIIILAPDDPDRHMAYAQEVFPFGKPVFVDKTFAVDAGEARRIIALGERLGTPFFSSSSLRFAPEFAHFAGVAESVDAFGSGDRFDIELIHPIEICAHLMGRGAAKIMSNGDREHFVAMLGYRDGRMASINFTLNCQGLGYSALVIPGKGGRSGVYAAKEHFFKAMIRAMLDFFRGPEDPPVSHADTLEGMIIRDGALKSLSRPGEWVEL